MIPAGEDAAPPRLRRDPPTGELRTRLEAAVVALRAYAASQRPFHPWHSLADDLEAFLNGRPTVLFLSGEDLLRYAIKSLSQVRRTV